MFTADFFNFKGKINFYWWKEAGDILLISQCTLFANTKKKGSSLIHKFRFPRICGTNV